MKTAEYILPARIRRLSLHQIRQVGVDSCVAWLLNTGQGQW